jgi:hypothetical protein
MLQVKKRNKRFVIKKVIIILHITLIMIMTFRNSTVVESEHQHKFQIHTCHMVAFIPLFVKTRRRTIVILGIFGYDRNVHG